MPSGSCFAVGTLVLSSPTDHTKAAQELGRQVYFPNSNPALGINPSFSYNRGKRKGLGLHPAPLSKGPQTKGAEATSPSPALRSSAFGRVVGRGSGHLNGRLNSSYIGFLSSGKVLSQPMRLVNHVFVGARGKKR